MNDSRNEVSRKQLTDRLADVIVRTLRPGFHGRGTLSFDVKDGSMIAVETTTTEKTLARKEYDHV